MKKITILFFFLFTLTSYSQYYNMGLSATGIYAEDYGYAANLSYSYRLLNYFDYLEVGVQVNSSELEFAGFQIPSNVYGLNVGYYWDFIRNNRRFFYNPAIAITLGGGFQVAQESFDFSEIPLDDDTQLNIETEKIVYGPYLGVNIDLFLTSFMGISFKASETYHINSDLGKFIPYAGFGLKFVIDND